MKKFNFHFRSTSWFFFFSLLLYLCGAGVGSVFSQTAGSLDSTFGNNGIVISNITNGGDASSSVVVQPDGKIIAVGTSQEGWGNLFSLIRYNSDGTVDESFGIGGKVKTIVINGSDRATSVALQLDGKIVVAGTSKGGSENFADPSSRYLGANIKVSF